MTLTKLRRDMLKLCGHQHYKDTEANIPHYENITVITPGSPCLKPAPPDPPVTGEIYIDGNTYKRCERTITRARQELLTSTGWTLGTGWTGSFAAGFTNDGSNNTLENSLAVSDILIYPTQQYRVKMTVTNRTTGSVTATWAGQSISEVESIITWSDYSGLVVTPSGGFDGTVKVSIKLYPDEVMIEHGGDAVRSMGTLWRANVTCIGTRRPVRWRNPFTGEPVTDPVYGGTVIFVRGTLTTADPCTSGTIQFNLDMTHCEKRGFKSVAALGFYLGLAPFDTCPDCPGDTYPNAETCACVSVAPTRYLGIRWYGHYILDNNGDVSTTEWDVGWVLDPNTGALTHNEDNAADTGWLTYAPPVIGYCNVLNTDVEPSVRTLSGYYTDGTEGSLGVAGDFDAADWTCELESGDPPICYARSKFKWTLTPTSIRYQYKYQSGTFGETEEITYSIDHDATVELSIPTDYADILAETKALLDLWDLSDDVQYPWRYGYCEIDATLKYNRVHNFLPQVPVEPFDSSSDIAGGTGELIGSPLPNGYGPHWDFDGSCNWVLGTSQAGAFKHMETMQGGLPWGGLAAYAGRVITLRKLAISHTGPGLGPDIAGDTLTGSGTNWSGDYTGFTHTAGSVVPLVTSLPSQVDRTYSILVTITGRTAGTVAISFGGTGSVSISSTYTAQIAAISVAALTATPSSDFDGTITFEVRPVPTGHWAFNTWDGSVCRDVAAGYTCTQEHTGLTPCNHLIGVVSSTASDADLPGVTIPLADPPALEDGIQYPATFPVWVCQPRFYRHPVAPAGQNLEYFCDDCDETPLPEGCSDPSNPSTYCDPDILAESETWV